MDEEFATREVAMEKTASQTKDNKKNRRKLIVTVTTLTCNEQRNSERAGHGGTLVAEAKSISAKQSNKNISGADRVAGDRRVEKTNQTHSQMLLAQLSVLMTSLYVNLWFWQSMRACSTRVRASAISPDIAQPT